MEHKHEEHTNEPVIEAAFDTAEHIAEKSLETVQVVEHAKRNEWLLPGSIVIAAALISISFFATGGLKAPETRNVQQGAQGTPPASPTITADDVVLGDPNAKATIIEYGDPQCPYCALFYAKFEPAIRKELIGTGKAKYVFKPFPFLGKESDDAAIALECAKDQGKFWELHNAIYDAEYGEVQRVMEKQLESSEGNGNLNAQFFGQAIARAGGDKAALLSCISSGKYAGSPEAFRKGADAVGVHGTPSLFVNGKAVDLQTYSSPEKFVQYVDSLVQ